MLEAEPTRTPRRKPGALGTLGEVASQPTGRTWQQSGDGVAKLAEIALPARRPQIPRASGSCASTSISACARWQRKPASIEPPSLNTKQGNPLILHSLA